MKLAQGEYVALENVENVYSGSPIVAQLYVHGDSLQSYLIGVLIPDPVQLAAIASKVWRTHVSEKDAGALERAARDPKVVAVALEALNKQAKMSGLQGYEFLSVLSDWVAEPSWLWYGRFEMLKRIHIVNELLTVENGCLTPTLKIKR